MKVQAVDLKINWRWKERDAAITAVWEEVKDEKGWNTAQSGLPSEIHVELMKAQKIPDPYIGFNEHKVQCEWFPDSRDDKQHNSRRDRRA